MAWYLSKKLVANSPCSQERGGGSSAATCSDGEPSALSSSSPTLETFYLRAKTMESCRRSRSGMTSAPLTAAHGEGVLTWCQAGSRARTSAAQGEERVSAARDQDSGAKWLASFARFDLDSSSWKTPQCSLLGGSESFSETWPRSGSMLNGVCWERTISAHPIGESGSGFWPTPTTSTATQGPGVSGREGGPNLVTAVMWPTPAATNGVHGWASDRLGLGLGRVRVGGGPRPGFRLVTPGGQVFDETPAVDEVSVGATAGTASPEQLEEAASRALTRAAKMRARSRADGSALKTPAISPKQLWEHIEPLGWCRRDIDGGEEWYKPGEPERLRVRHGDASHWRTVVDSYVETIATVEGVDVRAMGAARGTRTCFVALTGTVAGIILDGAPALLLDHGGWREAVSASSRALREAVGLHGCQVVVYALRGRTPGRAELVHIEPNDDRERCGPSIEDRKRALDCWRDLFERLAQ